MIKPGMHVIATTADDRELQRVAASEVVDGADFPVVWICTEEEWASAHFEGRDPAAWPWPAEDIELADTTNVAAA